MENEMPGKVLDNAHINGVGLASIENMDRCDKIIPLRTM
jgi:hypothetical protein